jgi:hypothetical protein
LLDKAFSIEHPTTLLARFNQSIALVPERGIADGAAKEVGQLNSTPLASSVPRVIIPFAT